MNPTRFVIVVLLVTSQLQFGICQQGQLQTEIRITNYAECNEKQNTWHVRNISINYHYPGTYLNADFNVTEDIKRFSKLQLEIERCNDQGFNCEDFQIWRIENFCPLLTWKNQIWSPFANAIHPPFRCPVKKLVYHLRNATMDVDAAIKWYPDMVKYAWKATTKISNELDKLVYCVTTELHTYQYRKRNRKPKI